MGSNTINKLAPLALLLVMLAEVAFSTRQESPSWDEGDHIFAGYMNWKHGAYDLNPEHPPLVKLVATLPLLPLQLKVPPLQGRYFKDESYFDGHDLLFRNGPSEGGHYTADTLLFRIHMTVLAFALGLGLLLFLAAQEMFGSAAGLIALTLFVFDPTVLVNAPFVTTDMGATFGFFASVYSFYRFAIKRTWPRAILCGAAVGVALASKHSTVLLLPILLLLGAGELAARWKSNRRWPAVEAKQLALGSLAIAAIAIFLLWGVYSFRFAMHPQGVAVRTFAASVAPLSPTLRTLLSTLERYHLLPESYIYGFADVVRVGNFMPAYIFGKLYLHGQWFYFPAILSLKWTPGVLGLLVLSIYAFATGKVHRAREVFFLAVPAIVYLAVAMVRTEDIGVRHVLPIFPFAFAFAGGGAAWLIQQRRLWLAPVAALLLWHVVDSLRMFPNYMPYANVFWGGPSKTNLYFTDSATEWGQELKWVKQWTDSHHVTQCWIAYFPAPFLLPSDYGIPCRLLPTPDTGNQLNLDVPPIVHGPILISYPDLNGFESGTRVRNPYQTLFERKPDDVIANAVAVYYGDYALPDASAAQYIQRGQALLNKHPDQALALAHQAVAASPQGFDANRFLGDALIRNGDPAGAIAAYQVAKRRLADMEPGARQYWGVSLDKSISKAIAKAVKPH
jgi:hypothetical protein